MAVQIAILLVLILLGVVLVWAGARGWQRLISGAGNLPEPRAEPAEAIEPQGPVGPEGLVVLFAHEFVDRASGKGMVSPRLRCYAPITDDELDPLHWAQQMLYASLATLHEAGCVEMRVVERAATFMPPYPQKNWELQLRQIGPMPEAPISDVLAVAFDLIRRRQRAETEEEEGALWVALDTLIEHALRTMRQEISFWQRSGVYGDIRQYIEAALIAQGYLLEPARPTWLDRVRHKRPRPHEETVERLQDDARQLANRLAAFQRQHGAGLLEAEKESEALKQVDASLLTPSESLDELPLDESLRISIYETLVSLRQLEPSGEGV